MNLKKDLIVKQVRHLRMLGKTYSEINLELRINKSKSTLSWWCKGIELPNYYTKKIRIINKNNLNKARSLALKVNKNKRLNYLMELKNKNLYLIDKLDKSTQKIILSILYLAEGSKYKSTRYLSLSNSDPDIIYFYLKLLNNCFLLDRTKFRVRIQCRADQDIDKLEKFWSELLGVPKSQFYPTYVDKRTIGKPTKKVLYKGVCYLIYFDCGIQQELEFLSEAVVKLVVY